MDKLSKEEKLAFIRQVKDRLEQADINMMFDEIADVEFALEDLLGIYK